MWQANTLTPNNGNLWSTNATTVSNDLSEIEFSFNEKPAETPKPAATIHGGVNGAEDNQMEHNIIQRTLTPEIIAKIQAVDNSEDDVAAIQTDTTLSKKNSPRTGEKLGADLISDDLARHGVEMKDGDLLDESGRFIIRRVLIVKNSASPLGFFIRQGDGGFKKHGVFVSRVAQGSIVDANGLLKVGDEIIAVNYVDVQGFNLDDVVRMIQAPRKLILTIRVDAFLIKRSASVGDHSDSLTTSASKKPEKATSKPAKIKGKHSRANDYKEPSNECKQLVQTDAEKIKVDKNANEQQEVLKSVHSEDAGTIEELINAIRAQNNRSKKTRRNLEHSEDNKTSPEEPRKSTSPLFRQKDSSKADSPQMRKPSSTDSIILSNRTPPNAGRKSSTLTPVTTVNLIFDDTDEFAFTSPVTKNSALNEEALKISSVGNMYSRSPPGSPGGSPKTRRKLPSVPGDMARSSRSDSLSTSGTKPQLTLPAEPRSRRMLPTPPPSPVAPHKAEVSNGRKTSSPSVESPENARENRNSWTGSVDSDTPEEKSPAPSPSRKEAGSSLSQILGALALRNNSPVTSHKAEVSNGRKTSSPTVESPENVRENRKSWTGSVDSDTPEEKSPAPSPFRKEAGLSLSQFFGGRALRNNSDSSSDTEKSKDKERSEPSKMPSSPKRPTRKSESHRDDILQQQRHSMMLHSYATGGLQPPKRQSLTSRSSQPNLTVLMPVQEEPSKSKLSPDSSSPRENFKFSPKLTLRRASLASISDKSLANQIASQDLTDIDRLRSEAETGFLIFPDDYTGYNLLSSHAVSGMVSLHIIKATNLPFAEKKLLEKRKKVHCAVEVDFERKAFTSSKRESKTLTWDEVFEVEIQHGREVCLSCFTSSNEFNKPVAQASFNLSPFVRCGQQHNVVFRMHPQGAIHLKMEFIEMKTLLKRAPSDRKSGVFGFQLNVTSRNEKASVPLIVRKCVEEIEKRGLKGVGLYRISGNARRKKLLKAQFDEDSTSVDLSEESYPDVNIIAGILKDYLRELPEPLITESLSKQLIRAAKEQLQEQDVGAQKRALSKLLVQLPQNNRETLVYLLNHFMRVIAEKDTNKMDAHNLSVCFGPVLLCPPANLTDGKDLLDLKLHVKIVEFLIFLWGNAGVILE